MTRKARVAGVGMIPFAKPGRSDGWETMAETAIRLALADARLDFRLVQHAYAGFVYADSTAGQAAIYRVGATGIPIVNVNNNCATGSTALYLARQLVELGGADCVLAVGFEQMAPGAVDMVFTDRASPLQRHNDVLRAVQGWNEALPMTAQQFGAAALEYQQRHGARDKTFAEVSVKARRHAAQNPLALFKDPLTVDEVMGARRLCGPLTRLQACPPTCGAAAAILVSPEFAARHGLDATVEIKAQALTTDLSDVFEGGSMMKVVGVDMTRAAARQVYEAAGVGPDDVQVIELHDCFSANEIFSYEGLGLCPDGGAEKYILDGDNTYGGRHVTNPSGGLLSKGHPLGATGLAQCYELTHQVRGTAAARQVENTTHALQHNLGIGGACVVTLYGRA
jgi:acetyl-CoA acetyltransferase